jgi:hypothetical protein
MIPNGTISSTVHTLRLSRTGRANTGIGRDAPDVAPLDKGGLTSQIRHENCDEGSGADPGPAPGGGVEGAPRERDGGLHRERPVRPAPAGRRAAAAAGGWDAGDRAQNARRGGASATRRRRGTSWQKCFSTGQRPRHPDVYPRGRRPAQSASQQTLLVKSPRSISKAAGVRFTREISSVSLAFKRHR